MEEIVKQYKPVGLKTLFMMVLRRSFVVLVMLLLFGVATFYINYLPPRYLDIALQISSVYLMMMIIIAAGVLFLGWLEYTRYGILLDEKDMKILRGLFSTEQIGIPYRRIQDIRITRTIIDQLIGVSNIIISIAPEENKDADQDVIILPSLDKNIALDIQSIVLKRAQVEQVHVVKY